MRFILAVLCLILVQVAQARDCRQEALTAIRSAGNAGGSDTDQYRAGQTAVNDCLQEKPAENKTGLQLGVVALLLALGGFFAWMKIKEFEDRRLALAELDAFEDEIKNIVVESDFSVRQKERCLGLIERAKLSRKVINFNNSEYQTITSALFDRYRSYLRGSMKNLGEKEGGYKKLIKSIAKLYPAIAVKRERAEAARRNGNRPEYEACMREFLRDATVFVERHEGELLSYLAAHKSDLEVKFPGVASMVDAVEETRYHEGFVLRYLKKNY